MTEKNVEQRSAGFSFTVDGRRVTAKNSVIDQAVNKLAAQVKRTEKAERESRR